MNNNDVLFAAKTFTVDNYFLFTLLTMPFPLHYSVLILIVSRAPLESSQGGSCNPQFTDKSVESEMGEMID